jgi:DNA (cytosine-5)-methyltransferase 1
VVRHTSSKKTRPLTAIDICAGAGGLFLGVHNARFRHLALIENDKLAATTLRHNVQTVLGITKDVVLEQDVRQVDLRRFSGLVDLLTAGPPCPPFSIGGVGIGYDDPRNMFPSILDAVGLIMPRAILIENVKGLLRPRFNDALEYIKKRLQFPKLTRNRSEGWRNHYRRLLKINVSDFSVDEQYTVSLQLIDSADYGIAQRRERVLIIAFRRDLGVTPPRIAPTHSRMALLVDQCITRDYWKRLGQSTRARTDHLTKTDALMLQKLRNNPAVLPPLGKPWITVRQALSGLPSPVVRGMEPTLPNHVQHPGARSYRNHSGSFLDYPAKALKAGVNGTPGGENTLRIAANKVRYFTTREAARLQTFPDEWVFQGHWGACIKQLGNAVPVRLTEQFANEIHRLLRI